MCSVCIVCVYSVLSDVYFILVIELECSIVLWSCYSNELLISLKGEGPINDLSWDPAIAYEFVTVGVASLAYWRMSVQDNTVDVKLHKPEQQSRSKASVTVTTMVAMTTDSSH